MNDVKLTKIPSWAAWGNAGLISSDWGFKNLFHSSIGKTRVPVTKQFVAQVCGDLFYKGMIRDVIHFERTSWIGILATTNPVVKIVFP